MSLYRFFRTSALLALAGKYRARLFRIVAAVLLALVTSWLYADIADYLKDHQPALLGRALLAKTVIVYGALVYALWQVRPGAWVSEPKAAARKSPAPTTVNVPAAGDSPLDELLEKPELQSRRDAILKEPPGGP